MYKSGKVVLASRFSYELHKGTFDKHLFVCHTCDNPKCVNPEHLFLGTQLDNMRDMWSKNRGYRGGSPGSTNPMSKLTEQDVLKIKQLLSQGLTQQSIAEEFGVIRQTISDIKRGRRWTYLNKEEFNVKH